MPWTEEALIAVKQLVVIKREAVYTRLTTAAEPTGEPAEKLRLAIVNAVVRTRPGIARAKCTGQQGPNQLQDLEANSELAIRSEVFEVKAMVAKFLQLPIVRIKPVVIDSTVRALRVE